MTKPRNGSAGQDEAKTQGYGTYYSTSTLDDLLKKLERVKHTGTGYIARCPAHDDQNPSLSISEGADRRILLRCHAGCETESIVTAIGLKMSDLFADGSQKRHATNGLGKIVETYDYPDEQGNLLYQVARFEPKDFRPRRPNSNSGWMWGLGDVRRVLYRLPELIAADPSEVVFCVEGEKDVDRLHSLRLVATCNVGGAVKWRNEYGECLRDRHVTILPDNDEPGRKHAEQVARSLHSTARSVKIVDLPGLPPKGDVSDWLDAGGTVEDLLNLVASASCWEGINDDTDEEQDGDSKRPSKAQLLIELASGAELFHNAEGRTFATVEVNGHHETHFLKSAAFKRWLVARFWQEHKTSVHPPAIAEALATLEGRATYEGETREVHTRLAELSGNIYLDLCDADWRAVEIAPSGWRVVTDCPVRFRRANGMLPLPEPQRGGSVADLRDHFNLGDEFEQEWILIAAWLVAALRPRGPYPVLCLHGEQGSAKSTMARMLRALMEPNTAALRSAPKDERDLMIAANNSWVLAFDNLTHISESLSNALCRLATGGGFATRELYANDEEVIFDAQRPLLLNGINEVANKSDLLDRSILIYLPTIPEAKRRDEETIWREFNAARPHILGNLLDAVSVALREMPGVKLKSLPRMADFAKWATAAESGLKLEAGAFMNAYIGNRRSANDIALEISPVATELREMFAQQEEWEGTSTALLTALNGRLEARQETPRHKPGWPQSPRALTDKLKILTPNLRAAGLDIQVLRSPRQRLIRITHVKTGISSVTSVTASLGEQNQQLTSDTSKSTSDAVTQHRDTGDAAAGASDTAAPNVSNWKQKASDAVTQVTQEIPAFTNDTEPVNDIASESSSGNDQSVLFPELMNTINRAVYETLTAQLGKPRPDEQLRGEEEADYV